MWLALSLLATSSALSLLATSSDYCGARYDASLLAVRQSPTCDGVGVFAVRDVPPRARLAEIPLAACVTAAAAEAALPRGAARRAKLLAKGKRRRADGYAARRDATRALLARLPHAAADEPLAAYARSLPWFDDADDIPERWLAETRRCAELADASEARAWGAVRLARSRAFDLGERGPALVPFLDLFNHPTPGTADACVAWRVDGGAVVVDAPDAATPAGSELWNWYGDADEPREREAFIENFGFDPG